MPRRKGIQRTYTIDHAGVAERFSTRAQRATRVRSLIYSIKHDRRMFRGRVRAYMKRRADYTRELAILDDLMRTNDAAAERNDPELRNEWTDITCLFNDE